MEIAVLALGCFWGPEIKFSKINGVIKTEVGYAVVIVHKPPIKKFAQVVQIMLKLLRLIMMRR
tara:strand:- start:584 stop:772 length:189 start_codon:yes stop_codon:yes gene_type:complete